MRTCNRRSSRGWAVGLAILLAAAVTAGCSQTQSAEDIERHSVAAETVRQFKEIDTTGAGRITFEQAVAHYTRRFAELDLDRNGRLDARELTPMLPVLQATTGDALLRRLDNNSDGQVSLTEFLILANVLFERTNRRDGTMTLDDARRLPDRQLPPLEPTFEGRDPSGAIGRPRGRG